LKLECYRPAGPKKDFSSLWLLLLHQVVPILKVCSNVRYLTLQHKLCGTQQGHVSQSAAKTVWHTTRPCASVCTTNCVAHNKGIYLSLHHILRGAQQRHVPQSAAQTVWHTTKAYTSVCTTNCVAHNKGIYLSLQHKLCGTQQGHVSQSTAQTVGHTTRACTSICITNCVAHSKGIYLTAAHSAWHTTRADTSLPQYKLRGELERQMYESRAYVFCDIIKLNSPVFAYLSRMLPNSETSSCSKALYPNNSGYPSLRQSAVGCRRRRRLQNTICGIFETNICQPIRFVVRGNEIFKSTP
jgi:hypothetical protein